MNRERGRAYPSQFNLGLALSLAQRVYQVCNVKNIIQFTFESRLQVLAKKRWQLVHYWHQKKTVELQKRDEKSEELWKQLCALDRKRQIAISNISVLCFSRQQRGIFIFLIRNHLSLKRIRVQRKQKSHQKGHHLNKTIFSCLFYVVMYPQIKMFL